MEFRRETAGLYYGSLLLVSWKTYLLGVFSPFLLSFPEHAVSFLRDRLVSVDYFGNSREAVHDRIHTAVEGAFGGQWAWDRMWRPLHGWFLLPRPLTVFYRDSVGWTMYSFWGRRARLAMIGADETDSIRVAGNYSDCVEFRDPIAEFPWQRRVLDRFAATPARNVVHTLLVVGPPGVGKTKLGILLAKRTRSERVDPLVIQGVTLEHMSKRKEAATARRPLVCTFDEVEVGLREKTGAPEGTTKSDVTSFLDTPHEHRTYIATSNLPLAEFPDWFVRRFDLVVEVDKDAGVQMRDGLSWIISSQ